MCRQVHLRAPSGSRLVLTVLSRTSPRHLVTWVWIRNSRPPAIRHRRARNWRSPALDPHRRELVRRVPRPRAGPLEKNHIGRSAGLLLRYLECCNAGDPSRGGHETAEPVACVYNDMKAAALFGRAIALMGFVSQLVRRGALSSPRELGKGYGSYSKFDRPHQQLPCQILPREASAAKRLRSYRVALRIRCWQLLPTSPGGLNGSRKPAESNPFADTMLQSARRPSS